MGLFIPINGEIWTVGMDFVTVIGFFVVFYLFYSYIKALKRKNRILLLSFIGFSAYLLTLIFDAVSFISGSDLFVAHFGLMLFIIVQSQVTGVQYARSFLLTRRLKDELETKNRQIIEKEKARTLFFHNTSHELRTP